MIANWPETLWEIIFTSTFTHRQELAQETHDRVSHDGDVLARVFDAV